MQTKVCLSLNVRTSTPQIQDGHGLICLAMPTVTCTIGTNKPNEFTDLLIQYFVFFYASNETCH
jgi:hypothetical protein